MTTTASQLKVETVITTHQNADFDAFAATVAASKLYPDAGVVFPGSLNRNVRDFAALHEEELSLVDKKQIDLPAVRRLIVVDTDDPQRLGELGDLYTSSDVEVIVFDHHGSDERQPPPFVRPENWVVSTDGAQVTSLLHIIREREMPISSLEATIFALGIHEDTGSLTYPRTTVKDAEMLALCLRLGASQPLIERFLHSPLTPDQRDLLLRVVDEVRAEHVRGLSIYVAALEADTYVDGLSVIAHKVMELLNCEVLLQAVYMEDRVFVTGRSRSELVDVGRLFETIGGGGHPQAASAIVRDRSAAEVIDSLLEAAAQRVERTPTAADIMSRPVRFLDADTTVQDALIAAQRYGHSGISVKEDGRVVGIVARRDLDKAVRHGLGHAPIKGVMSRNVVFSHESATIDEIRRIMAENTVGRVPILTDTAYDAALRDNVLRVEDVIGIATRTDVLDVYQESSVEEPVSAGVARSCLLQPLTEMPYFQPIFRAAFALSDEFAGVYMVGGFVRDLLLGHPNADIDIAVEGSGIEFARRLATQLGGRVRPHKKFQTAVVLLPLGVLGRIPPWWEKKGEWFHVDVATTRTEFYDYPAALPSVEHASIRQDLFRRDFTINAMGISLKGDSFGVVLDFFGGLQDLSTGTIRVLHNLSFIEDPTRIFRAVRYENRYGFRMDSHTYSLARGCVEMHLVGDLSSARLRDELIALLSENDIEWTLKRLHELGVTRQVHPKLATGNRTVVLIRRLDELVDGLVCEPDQSRGEVKRWRLRLSALVRRMEHDELYIWLEKLRLKKSDAQVIRKSVVMGPRVQEQLEAEELTDWELCELLADMPLESILLAMGEARTDVVGARLDSYLRDIRHRLRLDITGTDIKEMGIPEGPEVGRILRTLTRLRVEGGIDGREEQLLAARRLVKEWGG